MKYTLKRAAPRLITVVGILTICLGAQSKSCKSINENAEASEGEFNTVLRLENLQNEETTLFDVGESITFRLEVSNLNDRTARVEFPTTRVEDFVVVEQDSDDVVWRASQGQSFPDTLTEVVFGPNEKKTFTVTWDQRLLTGGQVREGTYRARGVLVYEDFNSNPLRENQLGSQEIPFEIRNE